MSSPFLFFKQLQLHTSQALKGDLRNYELIMGNESMDVDSFVSSLLYGYYRYYLSPQKPLIIVLNLVKKRLQERKYLCSLLKLCELSAEPFLFAPDLKKLKPEAYTLHLVDHHQLPPHQEFLGPQVKGFVDHHPPEKIFYPNLAYKHLSGCASCATLIWQLFEQKAIPYQTPLLANLWLCALYLDTHFFTHPEKITPLDEKAYQMLSPHASASLSFFQKLSTETLPDTELSLESQLQWDLKSYRETNSEGKSICYALSTFPHPISFESFVKQNGEQILQKLCREKQWDFFLLLLASKNPKKPSLLGYFPSKASAFFSIQPSLAPVLLHQTPLFPSPNLFLSPLIPYCSRKALKAALSIKDIDI